MLCEVALDDELLPLPVEPSPSLPESQFLGYLVWSGARSEVDLDLPLKEPFESLPLESLVFPLESLDFPLESVLPLESLPLEADLP